jgi:hypothetical protein
MLAVLVAFGCTDVTEPEMTPDSPVANRAAVRVEANFTMTVTGFGDYFIKEMGKSGRGLVRDYQVLFDASGDLVGSGELILNANYDPPSWWLTGPGVAPTWGTVTFSTDDGVWAGNLTGEFVFDPALHPWNPQLFSKVNLHGPDGAKFKGVCDETSPESEVLACSGEILSPAG